MDLNTKLNKSLYKNNIKINQKVELKSNSCNINLKPIVKLIQVDDNITYDNEVILCPHDNGFKNQNDLNSYLKSSIEEFESNDEIINNFEDLILKYQIAKL